MRPDPINWGFVNSCVLAEMAAVLLWGHWREERRGGGGEERRGGGEEMRGGERRRGKTGAFLMHSRMHSFTIFSLFFSLSLHPRPPPQKKQCRGLTNELNLKAKGQCCSYCLLHLVQQRNLDTPLNTGAFFFTLLKYIQI